MNSRSESIRVYFVTGSRRISNFCWASVLLLGSSGFFCVGLSSYFGKDIVPLLPAQQILFVPQGIVMCFYGIAGFFVSLYFWCTIYWDVGGGYDRFDKGRGIFIPFRRGFPGRNRRVLIQNLTKDIQAIRIDVQQGLSPRRVLRIKMKGHQEIPLGHVGDNFALREIEEKAAELARFLGVSVGGF
uniref:Photosystem I assembly protein Ycf4 n=1 Tax=Haplomitrium blumei TaxID=258993 RepID=A0A4Y5P7U5_9MARC|nr:photosystem I assembly protein Ycf4 [Haplomitrium blumei]QCW59345.1 photosystem I assembly protein Ycf4 [Haplomitrium blumei]